MPDLFVPPDGSLQFLISKPGPSNGLCVWVVAWDAKLPFLGKRPQCSCVDRWRIIYDSLPLKHREAADQLRTNIIVCSCVGKIIE